MCCYVLKDEKLIHIEEKTKEFKYEFLSSYIPMWNKIICGRGRRRRAIIDTHAGTGKVRLEDKELNKKDFSYGKFKSFMEGQRFIDDYFDLN